MNNILYLSLTGMTEPLGRSQVLEYLIDLSKWNKIYLVSFEREEDDENLQEIRSMTEKYNIEWQYLKYSNKYGLFSTMGQIIRTIMIGSNLIREKNIDIIHSRSMIPAVIGVVLKKVHRVKLLFDIRGFLIDEKIDSGRLKEDSLLFKVLKCLDNYLYKVSDHIVTLTQNAKEVLIQKLQIADEKITVIPTCANKDLFKIMNDFDKGTFKKSLGFSEKDIIVIHTGTVLNRYDFDTEVNLFKKLMDKDSNYKFLLVNKGEHEYIKKIFHQVGISENNFLITSSSFDKMYYFLNIADFALFFIPPTFAKKAMAPTKFAENIACKLPTVTNGDIGDMGFYLTQYNVGAVIDLETLDENIEIVADKLLEQVNLSELQKDDFDRLFSEHFDKNMAVEKYNKIYKNLIGDK